MPEGIRTPDLLVRSLYEDLHEAYLHPDAMKGLLLAQQELKKRYPGRRLIVYDACLLYTSLHS